MKNDYDYNDIEQRLEALKSVTLSAREKLHAREVLEEFMAFRPQRAPAAPRPARWNYFYFHPMPMIALLLLVVMTTSTAAAAEGALPGDLLYPIKVHVTEEVRAAVAVQPAAKAAWAIERAERRLDEAAQLNTEDRLDDAVREELALAVETHVRAAEALVLPPVFAVATEGVMAEANATATTAPEVAAAPSVSPTSEDDSTEDSDERERVLTRIAIARESKARLIDRHLAVADTRTARSAKERDENESRKDSQNQPRQNRKRTVAVSRVAEPLVVSPTAPDTFAASLAVESGSSTSTSGVFEVVVLDMATTAEPATSTSATTTEREVKKAPTGRLRGLQEGVRRRLESVERSLARAEARYGVEAFVEVRTQLEKVKGASQSSDQQDELLDDAEDALDDLLDVMDKTQGTINMLQLGNTVMPEAILEDITPSESR